MRYVIVRTSFRDFEQYFVGLIGLTVPALQMISATESHHGEHGAHVRGVSAILSAGESRLDLVNGVKAFQLADPLLIGVHTKVGESLSNGCSIADENRSDRRSSRVSSVLRH
jgi:hypothetical protein